MKIFYKFLFEVDCEYFQWVSSIIGIEETLGETEIFVKLVRRGESGNIRIAKLLLLASKFSNTNLSTLRFFLLEIYKSKRTVFPDSGNELIQAQTFKAIAYA